LFNKKDMLDEEGKQNVQDLMELYTGIGVSCFSISALHEDQDVLRDILHDKVTLIAGHSGVGKSTLLNKIAPHIKQTVGDVSDFSSKGTHTTTFAEMFPLDEKTYVIDTPGIKEWGLVDMNAQEISDYFPEMREVRLECKFGARCIHVNEPQCAVIDAIRAGKIALTRYENYLSMVMGQDNRR